jgi:Lactate dehydrogenase and related dehydrogenases
MSEGPVQSRKICFVDLESEGREFFAQALEGHEVRFVRELADVPEDCEVLSVFINERIDDAFLEVHSALKLICTRSTGCDHIDLDACRARGVKVTNVSNYGENTVAEHAFALILALTRRLRESEEAVRTGHFSRDGLRGFDLRGRTMGVVGAGRVGMHVIRIALGFGMKVVAYDAEPHAFYAELLDFRYVSFGELLRESHVISLHVPLNDSTRHMFNRETFALCRPGAILINTARGGLIDTAAAVEALDSGQLAGLGLDVLEDERVFREGGAAPLLGKKIAERVHAAAPGPGGRETSPARVAEFSRLVSHSRLLHRPDVILTPHVAFNSEEAIRCLRAVTLESMLDYFESKPLKHLCT